MALLECVEWCDLHVIWCTTVDLTNWKKKLDSRNTLTLACGKGAAKAVEEEEEGEEEEGEEEEEDEEEKEDKKHQMRMCDL